MNNLPDFFQTINGELWFTEDDRQSLKISYKVKDVLYNEKSPYQHIMLIDTYDFGKMLILDGVVQTTAIDGYIYNEMITHVPISFHPNPKRVLIIGGGDCGAVREIAKYDFIEQIDMVEIDESVTKVCKEKLPEVSGNVSDSKINFIFDDGIAHIKTKKDYYDIVVVDSSDPVGPAVCLFELEFYKNVYESLRADGIMVCQSESPIFYEDTMRNTYISLKSLFPIVKLYTATVPTYPGGWWTFTMASKKYETQIDSEFDYDTKYVNKGILKSCFELPEFVKKTLT